MVQLPVIEAHDIRFTPLSTTQGLSQTKVSQIVEDERGFIWFGTQYGLNRYDGYNFKVFVNDPKNPNSLSGTLVSALFKDRHGMLWIGCSESLNQFDPVTETFKRFPIPLVNHISEDRAGWLWLSTGQGLFGLDPVTGHIDHYIHDTQAARSLSGNDVKSTMEDHEGSFWVITSEGLDQFDRRAKAVTLHVPLKLTGREANLHEDRRGVLWLSYVTGNGLAVFDRPTRTLTRYSFNSQEQPGTALTGVSTILEDRGGNLWFATMNRGLLKLDQQSRSLSRYFNSPSDADSLPRDGVLSLCEDRGGGIWAGFVDSGLTHFDPHPPPFEKFSHNLGVASPGSSEPFVTAINEDHGGVLWIGSLGALSRLDRRTGEHKTYRFSQPGVASPDVLSITEDRAGVLWVGTFNGGLVRFDRATARFKIYRHDASDPYSLSNDIVTRIRVDGDGSLWVATWDGLNRFDPATERFTRYYFDVARKDVLYIDLVEGPDGALWLGTHSSGLQRFDGKSEFTSYQRRPRDPASLSDSRINSVHFDRSGTLWLGTQNGLDRFDPKTAKVTTYTKQDGLAGNVVGCILDDDRGDLWMSTNDGISQFHVAGKTFRNYSIDDGLPGRDLTGWGACFKNPSGEMFFGGFSGGAAFYPEKVTHPSAPPSIVLTDFRLFGKPVPIGPRSILSKSIPYTSAITLSHGQNVFSLEFAAPNHSATTRYRYKLDSIDSQWNETAPEQRVVAYAALPAGVYVFRAQAAPNQGDWTQAGIALKITILPPWWSTLWFRALYCGLLALIVWWIWTYRLRRIARQFELRLDERVSERTRIARELHDTLLQSFHGLLFRMQAARNMLPLRAEQAGQTLEGAIARAEQAIAEGRNAIQNLRSEGAKDADITQLMRAVGQELASQQESGSPATFRVTVEGERQPLSPILQDEVYGIAREILRNAFQHANARKIEVEIRYDSRGFRLRIRDDGRGIDPQVLKQGKRGGHWGLPGIQERAKQIGARLDLWSELGAGTEIEVIVPASLAYLKSGSVRAFPLFRRRRTHAR